ncbi:MAG TPA: protein translocase subunit SecD [Ktedonobacteraceae bacterium]|nr:protein translocase subunit SecD [Ktedonobacteraceae bacterium]
MRRGTPILLFIIILLALGAAFVDFWPHVDGGKGLYGINNPFTVTLGLDLQGGERFLLAPKLGQNPTDDEMNTTRQIIESRVNGGLGVKEPSIRVQHGSSGPSIVVELPKFSGDQESTVSTLLNAGLLEFWITGPQGYLADNTPFDPSQYTQYNPGGQAQFKGKDLKPDSLQVGTDQTGNYSIQFAMQGDAATKLTTLTQANQGSYLTITLDKKVITSAVIQNTLPGNGEITGKFTADQAQALVNVLKYGALPVNLEKISEETIGGTLGQEAINKSLLAGALGLGIVILFMLIYYRLPGLLADLALIIYSLLTFAIFKLIGVTMTLPGIAGFILSIGMAVDANVLIFERVKEELRAGRLMSSAVEFGWKRAWPSIRDSNSSTMITCAVLYTFGQNFGATIITGFATTLFLGVVISMFTAVVVTRSFLNLLIPTGVINHPALFGLPASAIPAPALARRNSTV